MDPTSNYTRASKTALMRTGSLNLTRYLRPNTCDPVRGIVWLQNTLLFCFIFRVVVSAALCECFLSCRFVKHNIAALWEWNTLFRNWDIIQNRSVSSYFSDFSDLLLTPRCICICIQKSGGKFHEHIFLVQLVFCSLTLSSVSCSIYSSQCSLCLNFICLWHEPVKIKDTFLYCSGKVSARKEGS